MLATVMAIFLCASAAQAADGSVADLVVTTDGTHLRGVIVENDPQGVVKIMLPDHDIHTFERAQIFYAGTAANGPVESGPAGVAPILPSVIAMPQFALSDPRFYIVTATTVFDSGMGYVEGPPRITIGGKEISQRDFLRIAAPSIGRGDLWTREQAKFISGITLLAIASIAIPAGIYGIVDGTLKSNSPAASGGGGGMPWQFYTGLLGGVLGGALLGATGVVLLAIGMDTATAQDIAAKYNARVAGHGATLEPSTSAPKFALAPLLAPGNAGMQLSISF
ncbi:MAG: hypothetical protein ABSB49_03180 [Polyangia bacterium]